MEKIKTVHLREGGKDGTEIKKEEKKTWQVKDVVSLTGFASVRFQLLIEG